MKKVVIVVCILVTGLSLVYAKVKAAEAMKNADEARKTMEISEEQAREATKQTERIQDAIAEAIRQKSIADELTAELAKCQGK